MTYTSHITHHIASCHMSCSSVHDMTLDHRLHGTTVFNAGATLSLGAQDAAKLIFSEGQHLSSLHVQLLPLQHVDELQLVPERGDELSLLLGQFLLLRHRGIELLAALLCEVSVRGLGVLQQFLVPFHVLQCTVQADVFDAR